MEITIREISGKKALKKYVQFNIDLYKENPYAVPPLIFDEVGTLSPDKTRHSNFANRSIIWPMMKKNQSDVSPVLSIIR